MKNIVILISGRGSNMQALVKACTHEKWPAHISAVISNVPLALGLTFAEQQGIATQVVDHKQFSNRIDFDKALMLTVDKFSPDVVVLAGFMRILTPGFVQHYAGRLLNIHPSLLPAFPGLNTHQRAIDAGCKVAGATVHFVTPDLDHGPIVAQAVVPVFPTDTASTLGDRVLQQEHRMYPQAVKWVLDGQVRFDENAQLTHDSLECSAFFNWNGE